jgi:solute carrier family 25 protein 33/36
LPRPKQQQPNTAAAASEDGRAADKLRFIFSAAVANGTASINLIRMKSPELMREQQGNMADYRSRRQRGGAKGLYGGMGVHLMKVVPNSAITFSTHEIVNSWLDGFNAIDDSALEMYFF